MEDWDKIDSVDEELKKLEDEFSTDDGIMRELAAPSAADYWKKRLDEEKELWSRMIETKEEEKKALQAKMGKQERDLASLKEQLKNMKQGLEDESQAWQARLRTKETEMLLEKERVSWDEKFKSLQYDNRILREEAERAGKLFEKEKEEMETASRKELGELLEAQNVIIENLDTLETEMKQLEETTEAAVRDRDRLNEELAGRDKIIAEAKESYGRLQGDGETLREKLEYVTGLMKKRRADNAEYSSCVMRYFVEKLKDKLGTVLGVISYCMKRLRFGSRVLRKQMAIVSGVIDRILRIIEDMSGLVMPRTIDFQELLVERLFAKLGDDVDTSEVPLNLKLRVNYPELKKAASPYFDRAARSSVKCREIAAGYVLTLNIVVPGEVKQDLEFVKLRHVVFLHEWSMVTIYENGNTAIIIEIPVLS